MSSLCCLFFIFLSSFFFPSLLSTVPTALIIPIKKDPSTLQYTTTIHHETPLKPTKLLIDLDASFPWDSCKTQHSSSYNPIPCNSTLCTSIVGACSTCYKLRRPRCTTNNSCALYLRNPFTRQVTVGHALRKSISLPTTNGRNPGPRALISNFTYACSSVEQTHNQKLLKGLAKGVTGSLALGPSRFSLPAQVSTALSCPRLFTLCLSASPSAPGVAFFGSAGPYYFLPNNIDLSNSLNYTSLLSRRQNHPSPFHHSHAYYIEIRSVKVNGNVIMPLNASFPLTVRISTIVPYTRMETSIYKAFTEAFVREAADSMHLYPVTHPVKPFQVCYSSDVVTSTNTGPAVPTVDLEMKGKDGAFWRIYGTNSMVRIVEGDKDIWCLGFVDGGTSPPVKIVIGGHQMEDNLLQFDLGLNRFGFTSSLLVKETLCANFNFTVNR